MRNAVDFETAPTVEQLVAADVDPIPYTGNARPSQDWFDAVRAAGYGPKAMTQETYSTRSQEGFQAGVLDCQFAESRAKERGHTGSIAVVVSDGNSADRWDAGPYGAGWASVATLPFFPYGALGVTATFLAGAFESPLLITGEWVPETWGAGRLMSQVVGSSPIPGTDLNIVHADYTGTTTPTQPTIPEEDAMILVSKAYPSGNTAVLVAGSLVLKTWHAEDAASTYGIPNDVTTWVNQPGHHHTVLFVDPEDMVKLLAAQPDAPAPAPAPAVDTAPLKSAFAALQPAVEAVSAAVAALP